MREGSRANCKKIGAMLKQVVLTGVPQTLALLRKKNGRPDTAITKPSTPTQLNSASGATTNAPPPTLGRAPNSVNVSRPNSLAPGNATTGPPVMMCAAGQALHGGVCKACPPGWTSNKKADAFGKRARCKQCPGTPSGRNWTKAGWDGTCESLILLEETIYSNKGKGDDETVEITGDDKTVEITVAIILAVVAIIAAVLVQRYVIPVYERRVERKKSEVEIFRKRSVANPIYGEDGEDGQDALSENSTPLDTAPMSVTGAEQTYHENMPSPIGADTFDMPSEVDNKAAPIDDGDYDMPAGFENKAAPSE